MKLYILIILTLTLTLTVSTYSIGQVRGRITDSKTGDPLAGATVLASGSTIGTTTDGNGEFNSTFPIFHPHHLTQGHLKSQTKKP